MDERFRQKTPLRFYRSSVGTEPVRAWLRTLDESELTLARKRQKDVQNESITDRFQPG